MRKIFFLSVLMLAANWLQAQFSTVKFTPPTFTAEDEVVFTIDLTGSGMAGKTEAFIWIWANEGAPGYDLINGLTNGGDWGNSKPEAKMTNKGGNVWEFKFTGTTLFGVEPGKLKHFQFLVKSKDGSSKTDNSPSFLFDPIVFSPVPFRVFPGRLGVDDVATVYLHQALAPSIAEQRMTPKTVTVKLFDDGGVQIGTAKTWNVKSEANGVFSYSFIPSLAWTIPAGKTAGKFTYRFDGTGKDDNGNNITVTGATSEKVIEILK